MPSSIKQAAIALLVSLASTLIAVYFDSLVYEDLSFSDPFTLGINAVWALIIAWVLWDLYRGVNIKPTLVLVGLVMLAGLIWDVYEFGLGLAQLFYGIELSMFVVAYFLVSSKESSEWYEAKNL